MPIGKCHVCGLEAKLSFEHVPPKGAFNSSSLLRAKLEDLIGGESTDDPRSVRKSTERRGAGGYTLCERCNNDTGGWYGNAYVWWAHQGMEYRLKGGSSLALPYFLFPGRVSKMIMCMFASACGDGFFEGHPDLRKFVLDRDAMGIPGDIRLYAYMTSPRTNTSRQSGISVRMGVGSSMNMFSEIAFPPFGYIMTLDSPPPDPELLDITFFTHHTATAYREMHLPIPMREINGYFPADFRTVEQWDATLTRSAQLRRERALAALQGIKGA